MPLGHVNDLQVLFSENEKSNEEKKRQSEDVNSNVLIWEEFGSCTDEKYLISWSFFTKYVATVHSNAQIDFLNL